MGRPYFVNRSQLTSEEKAEYDTGWKNNDFNEFVSNRIPLQRSLPDPRDVEWVWVDYTWSSCICVYFTPRSELEM